jgi:heme/copper-type cytochrome/quinol oxidase subunit 2
MSLNYRNIPRSVQRAPLGSFSDLGNTNGTGGTKASYWSSIIAAILSLTVAIILITYVTDLRKHGCGEIARTKKNILLVIAWIEVVLAIITVVAVLVVAKKAKNGY